MPHVEMAVWPIGGSIDQAQRNGKREERPDGAICRRLGGAAHPGSDETSRNELGGKRTSFGQTLGEN